MTRVDDLARFAVQASFNQISARARLQLKVRLLDALGCAIGAVAGPPVTAIRKYIDEFGGHPLATLIGGAKTSPDRAALYNSALIRYLDFNDAYLAKGETCHPSDNIGALLAASEYSHATGKDFLVSLAVAYQVLCRLCDVAPVRAKGFDHTTLGSFAVAAGISRALGLNAPRAANAIAISGTAFNALRVTRTGALSNWKGLAYPSTAASCVQAAFLAKQGITGPPEVFEGNKGFMEAISGNFVIDWRHEDLERVTRTIVKKYNAEIHSQSVLDAALRLKEKSAFNAQEIARIEIDVFDVAYNIIGGGEEGDKTVVATKEEADHSLPFMVASAILDGEVTPRQYLPENIRREPVQALLRKVAIKPNEEFSRRFPDEMPCRVVIRLRDGRQLQEEARDYEGFFTRPFDWDAALRKFRRLSEPYISSSLQQEISGAVEHIEEMAIAGLMAILARVAEPVNEARQDA